MEEIKLNLTERDGYYLVNSKKVKRKAKVLTITFCALIGNTHTASNSNDKKILFVKKVFIFVIFFISVHFRVQHSIINTIVQR